MAAVRRIWIWYLATVVAIAGAVAVLDPPAARLPHLALHAVLLVVVCALPPRSRVLWSVVTLIGLPLVFSACGLALPDLNPQPFEWLWIACDRALFGADPTVALQAWLSPGLVEVLQLAYASFYALPVVLLLGLARARAWPAFDDSLAVVAFGFLLSYLGYLVFPTLPPYRFLDHGGALVGWGLAEVLHAVLDGLEANRYDCFPSGHTMLTLITLLLARRHLPAMLPVLAPVGGALIVATVALRYHYAVDVLAGAALVAPAIALARAASVPP